MIKSLEFIRPRPAQLGEKILFKKKAGRGEKRERARLKIKRARKIIYFNLGDGFYSERYISLKEIN